MIYYAGCRVSALINGVRRRVTIIRDTCALQCRECGSRTFAIYGAPYIVQCAECRAEFSQVSEFIAIVEAETEKQELVRQNRRLH